MMAEKLPDLILTISIDRPTADDPDGYISMLAHTKVTGQVDAPKFEDAADGPIDEKTIAQVIADFRSYVKTGHKRTWASRFKKPGENGHNGHER
jgi:hypothetical protein